MNFFESIVTNIVFTSFPILLYAVFVAFKNKFKDEENNLLLELSIFCSLFFTLTFTKNEYEITFSAISLIPLVLCYTERKGILGIIISIILSDFFIKSAYIPFICPLILMILFYILYRYYKITNKRHTFLALSYYILIILYITISFFIKHSFSDVSNFKLYSSMVLIFTISYYVVLTIIFKAKNVMNMFMTLSEINKEKHIKTSLFKITHEIKNPIAVIKGYLEMFNPKDIIKSEKHIKIINEEVKNTLNILNDFKDFAKIKVTKEQMEFNKLLIELKEIASPFFQSSSIEYNFKSEENIIIYADYKRLKQVLVNIIKNSVEASTENSKITITSYKSLDKLIVIVKDNGIGMDKETLDNLFVPFHTTKDSGTGLGVCLSKEIIEAHNGNIYYTSILGRGTTVKIILPTL